MAEEERLRRALEYHEQISTPWLRLRIRIERWLGTRRTIRFPFWIVLLFPDAHYCYWRNHEPSVFMDGDSHKYCQRDRG